jgi:ABC-type polar amino acid transport system ATPase subunit
VNRLEHLNGGQIWIDDELVSDPRLDVRHIREEVGMVFQSFNLFPHLNALGNVTIGPIIVKKVPRPEAEAAGIALLERVGLADKVKSHPDQLSGGQQQRVAIARALAMNPKVMLFDEPTSALDPELVGEVFDTIHALADEGMTMIIVTHHMGFARELADRVIFMEKGNFLAEGTPQEFFAEGMNNERIRSFLNRIL